MTTVHRNSNRRPRFTLRSADLSHRLDTFLVVAVASVLGNRVFLVITGYPQLGNGTLHISHAIWGALMMAIAIIGSIAFLPPFTRTWVSFLGGAGFGWFIDELGKFITRDVNYFFKPTFALIYMTFVAMYLVFRTLERRSYSAQEGILNAIEALKSASIGNLEEPERREALALLDTTGASGDFVSRVRDLLDDVPTLPPRRPAWPARIALAVRARYLRITDHPKFPTAADMLFLVFATVVVVDVIALALDGPGIATFAERVTLGASIAAALLIVIGACLLPRNRLHAYHWFERGLLVQLYVVQIFVFAEEQLAGTIGLLVTLTVWIVLRSAMKAEHERAAMTSVAAS